jgi:deferrochelatase/peroxidase EfeB
MEYLRFTQSSVFAVPPGIAEGQFLGQALFARRGHGGNRA